MVERNPGDGVGESGEGETVLGVDGELGIDEENDGLLDGVQSGWGSAVVSGGPFHLDEALRIYVQANQNIFVRNSRGFQTVSFAASLTPSTAISFNSLHLSYSLSLSLSL
ncbi:hypothetical protein V8G54_007974 [Vigna mungo]|uniref:Uncharacterized protein n=1 Tax=Vigna mungo TaxID=3915 RepID=A0AAQ3P4R8_VIGMU